MPLCALSFFSFLTIHCQCFSSCFYLLFIYPDVFRVCTHSGCYPDYWAGQLALGTTGCPLFTGKERKTSFSLACMSGLYLTENRGILISFQVWELSLTAYVYIWASVFSWTGGIEYKNKVENTNCHFPHQRCVVHAHGLLLRWASLICVLVCVWMWKKQLCRNHCNTRITRMQVIIHNSNFRLLGSFIAS